MDKSCKGNGRKVFYFGVGRQTYPWESLDGHGGLYTTGLVTLFFELSIEAHTLQANEQGQKLTPSKY